MFDGYESDPESEPELESWVRIQQHTFTNWVNDKLRIHDLEVEKIRTDFKDGIKLCKLMEALKGRRIGRVIQKKILNHYEASGNMQVAFNAMAEDGVRLVNIGSEDVRSGNVKLILGLLWTLIRFYQIGSQSRLPAKALMLSWCNAILHPHMSVRNFSSDWSDGIALHGLIEYCLPGSCSNWHHMSKNDHLGNCQRAMQMAQDLLQIPMVMRPEDLASTDPDELSGMTYISYFMADESPGFKATLNWVRSQVTPEPVDNFDSDWNSGVVLASLVTSLGASMPDREGLDWKALNNAAIDTARTQLAIEPVLKATDLINPEVDHIGVMAHAAWHEASLKSPHIADRSRTPTPPPPPPPLPTMIPDAIPTVLSALPEAPKPEVSIVENCRIDSNMTIEVDTSAIGPGNITSTAKAPSGAIQALAISRLSENSYHMELIPTEKGNWFVHVLFNESDVDGSPFNVNVYDPSAAKITRDYGIAIQNDTYSFDVDAQQIGVDDISVNIVHEGTSIPHDVTKVGVAKYHVTFIPEHSGSYTVAVYSGGSEIPGSPFDLVCKLVEGIQASGRGLTEGVTNREAEFEIDTSVAPGQDLDVTVYGPMGTEIPHTTRADHAVDDLHRIYFIPEQAGEHRIEVLYSGVQIKGSPFVSDIRKSRVYIHDLSPYGFVGQQSKFRIDASEMKKGTLEIDSDLPVVSYDKLGPNTYMVTFVPRSAGSHDLVIKYNGDIVEGCPFEVDVKPSM